MNIVTTLVGLSIMGTAMPMVAQMSIQPHMALKRAENFGLLRLPLSLSLPKMKEQPHLQLHLLCDAPDPLSNGAYSITCTEGTGTPTFKP